MRLLVVLPLEPWFKGGVENVVKEYSKCLRKDHELTILCTRATLKKNMQKKMWMDIQVLIFKSYGGMLRISPGLVNYVKANTRKFDLLVLHNYSTMLPAQILWFKGTIQTPVVLTPHFHTQGSTALLRIFRIYYDIIFKKLFLKKIDALQFVSQTEKAEFLRKFPTTTLHKVIYNGIDIGRFTNKEIEKMPVEKKEILCVGRLEKYKNIQFVIRTLNYLPGEFTLVVMGTVKKIQRKRTRFSGKVKKIQRKRTRFSFFRIFEDN